MIRIEIEDWAKNHGANIYSIEWNEEVMDDVSSVKGIYKDSFYDYMNH